MPLAMATLQRQKEMMESGQQLQRIPYEDLQKI
jgi:hypothetical protein